MNQWAIRGASTRPDVLADHKIGNFIEIGRARD